MSEHVIPGRAGDLISLGAAEVLWAGLTAGSAVPTAAGVFACPPAGTRAGYVLLGGRLVAVVKTGGGRWGVAEGEVRRAAAELNTVEIDRGLVRIGPFREAPQQEHNEGTLLRWRQRVMREVQEPDGPGQTAWGEDGRSCHLAGIDWRQVLVERTRDGAVRTWWLPRAVVRLLDAAEHAETQWLHATSARQASKADTGRLSDHRQTRAADTLRQTASPEGPAAPLRPYSGELEGQLYSVLSRKPGFSRKVAQWMCAVCRTAPATVLDHCHEHGYARAPVCQSCNTQERPDHLYSSDIRVASRYTRLFHTGTDDWLRHWHRCSGCRARTTLPLPHLAAWTASIACRPLRPTHRASRGREPCGVLRVSWTGNQNAPRSCLLTVTVDFCPSGEHRLLAQVPYREAAGQFRTWLAETAPAVAAVAGPDRLDGLPAQPRPVIADTNGEGLALF
ncbi:endonuclease domain-containing protein [Streptomyces cinnamoneus]|uniref:endonuclease domain-containing protein n=1 Tax=Streptomyces cinnamoneus TaxID=53446 RepID=UPI0033E0F2FE